MSVMHHHPRFHLLISPQLLILFMTLMLFVIALWFFSLSQTSPTERAVPQPIVAVDQNEPAEPRHFDWLK